MTNEVWGEPYESLPGWCVHSSSATNLRRRSINVDDAAIDAT